MEMPILMDLVLEATTVQEMTAPQLPLTLSAYRVGGDVPHLCKTEVFTHCVLNPGCVLYSIFFRPLLPRG